MSNIYWGIANKNPYIMLQCKGYEKRHGKTLLRKWWYLAKSLYKNNSRCHGEILETADVYRLMESYDVVSFDIFDTLLVRPYRRPTDLFFELEKREKTGGFGKRRIEAEKKARERYREHEEVTLDQIYREIEGQYRHLKEKEMELEEEVLSVNFPVYDIYRHALEKKKKIIICSDMYLPKEFLESLLYKKGYGGFGEIFVSSDCKLTKGSGNLYGHVLKTLGVPGSLVLHIGDNLESDGNAKRQYGMGYVCVCGSMFVQVGKEG